MRRRDFLKSAGVVGTASLLQPQTVFSRPRQSASFFGLHPFVAAHPESVFVVVTDVQDMADAPAKLQVGQQLARQLFVMSDTEGIPSTNRIGTKPNLTLFNDSEARPGGMGIVTDADFIEGFIYGMGESAGVQGDQFHLREGNWLGDAGSPNRAALDWYGPMAERTGAYLLRFENGRALNDQSFEYLQPGIELIWREVPDGGMVFSRTGYMAPINADNGWNLNIAKLKTHGMGVTAAAKNWQGTNVHPHLHYCSSVPSQFRAYRDVLDRDINPEYRELNQAMFEQLLEAGVPRFDKPGNLDNWNSGPGFTVWSNKTVDNHLASNPGLHVVEGIYAQNGNFTNGPGPDGKPEFFNSNVVLFGQNPFLVDIIAHWIAGHEPGNFGLFHVARERGVINTVNPSEIPVYNWSGGEPARASLTDFQRTPLLTYYMQRDYDGQNEPFWHMVDEPYDYGPPTAVLDDASARPSSTVLAQNYPNPFNASTVIEYRLPQAGNARVEIYNATGQLVDVLADGRHPAGAHMVHWRAEGRATGTYFYRFVADGFQETRKMLLVR